MKYSHSGQKIPENGMRGPKIPENCILSQGFRTGFVLVGWFCTIRTGGRHAGDRKKRRMDIYAKYVFLYGLGLEITFAMISE